MACREESKPFVKIGKIGGHVGPYYDLIREMKDAYTHRLRYADHLRLEFTWETLFDAATLFEFPFNEQNHFFRAHDGNL